MEKMLVCLRKVTDQFNVWWNPVVEKVELRTISNSEIMSTQEIGIEQLWALKKTVNQWG